MFKRLTVAVAALFVLVGSAFAAGTIPGFSLAQQIDSNGAPLVGCKLYTIQAGTVSTPQTSYQDSDLTLPLPYPVLCDAYGRLPQIFLADGSIKLRLTKSNGTQVFALDGILVVGASSGGGGGSPVDATTILATGDVKIKYGTGVLSGFVRANGRTIGSATSGASERANADCQALFEYLWGADANLTVSTGRGASANADWVANKTIALPDGRGRVFAGLDDMGNSAASRLTAASMVSGGTTLGSVSSATETRTLTTTHLPPYTPSATFNAVQIKVGGNNAIAPFNGSVASSVSPGAGIGVYPNTQMGTIDSFTPSATFNAQGGASTPFPIVQPTILITYYVKL